MNHLVKAAAAVLAMGVLGACAGSAEPRAGGLRSHEGPQGPGFQKGEQVPFVRRDHGQVVEALRSAGLTICKVESLGATAAGDYAHWVVSVAVGECPGDISSRPYRPAELVVVRAFHTCQARDTLAFTGMGDGLAYWLYGDLTVSVTESSRPETIARVEEAMRNVPGAAPGLDKRSQ